MTVPAKYSVCMVLWRSSCLIAICMLPWINSASSRNDDFAKNDVIRYWETKLHGAHMPDSVRAMVSPLSSREASQLLIDIGAADGQYLPEHATMFCKAAHIQCGSGSLQSEGSQTEQAQKETETLFFYSGANEGKKPADGEDSSLRKPIPPKNVFVYSWADKGKKPSDGGHTSLKLIPPENVIFIIWNIGKQSQVSSQAKPMLNIHGEVEGSNASRILTSNGANGLDGIVFREKQVLVRGINVHENFASYEGDSEVDKANGRAFLPRKLTKLFPLRSSNGAEIASMLGVSYEDTQTALRFCDGGGHGMNAEVKKCVASIEDLADFVSSVLGASTHGIVMHNSIDNASQVHRRGAGDTFHVLDVETLTAEDGPSVLCHDIMFPFRVFFCHYVKQSKVFQVTLQGENGSMHERIAVCHYNTSSWNPLHVAFELLHTKPGESEVCHWLGGRSLRQIAWVFVRGTAPALYDGY